MAFIVEDTNRVLKRGIQPDVAIVFDPEGQTIGLVRIKDGYGCRMLRTNPCDNKIIVHFLRDKDDFVGFVILLGELLDLEVRPYPNCASLPAYSFHRRER